MGITKPALLVSAGLCLAWAMAQTQPANPTGTRHRHHSAAAGMTAAECKNLMARRQQMMADMKAMDARLDEKLAIMNAAGGQAKVNAMADVITEMVTQRRERQQKMMAMQSRMMSHMAGHMATGTTGTAGRAPMNCPMMQGPARPTD